MSRAASRTQCRPRGASRTCREAGCRARGAPESGTRPSSCPGSQTSSARSRRRPARSSPPRGRTLLPGSETAPALPCPKSGQQASVSRPLESHSVPGTLARRWHCAGWGQASKQPGPTCMVTSLSSTCTSLVRKSAPMVALYWLENFLLTYWFIREVLPTPLSPRIMTFNSVRLRWLAIASGLMAPATA